MKCKQRKVLPYEATELYALKPGDLFSYRYTDCEVPSKFLAYKFYMIISTDPARLIWDLDSAETFRPTAPNAWVFKWSP